MNGGTLAAVRVPMRTGDWIAAAVLVAGAFALTGLIGGTLVAVACAVFVAFRFLGQS